VSEYKQILYSVSDRIARITLNAPEKRNAISLQMRQELIDALRKAERDDSVSVVLLEGAGVSFCAGADLSAGSNAPEGGFVSEKYFDKWTDQMARHVIKDWLTIWDLLKPVVCKVQGHCLALGTELMSMCDIVFAADDARIGYPATRAQASPDTAYFPWKMTMARAKYLHMTGNWITGKTAAQWGWIAKSFPADQLETEVMKEVRALASIAPDQHASNKGCLNEAYEIMGFRTALAAGVHWHAASFAQVRPSYGDFRKIAGEKGMKEALAWRDGPFKETEGF
jgi:enoyl-CoA hydratase